MKQLRELKNLKDEEILSDDQYLKQRDKLIEELESI